MRKYVRKRRGRYYIQNARQGERCCGKTEE